VVIVLVALFVLGLMPCWRHQGLSLASTGTNFAASIVQKSRFFTMRRVTTPAGPVTAHPGRDRTVTFWSIVKHLLRN
jgi:hypothetical protein